MSSFAHHHGDFEITRVEGQLTCAKVEVLLINRILINTDGLIIAAIQGFCSCKFNVFRIITSWLEDPIQTFTYWIFRDKEGLGFNRIAENVCTDQRQFS